MRILFWTLTPQFYVVQKETDGMRNAAGSANDDDDGESEAAASDKKDTAALNAVIVEVWPWSLVLSEQ